MTLLALIAAVSLRGWTWAAAIAACVEFWRAALGLM